MSLKDKFKEKLLSHLSDHDTESNAIIACKVAEEYALEFAIYIHCAEKNKGLQKEIKQVFETFKKEYK